MEPEQVPPAELPSPVRHRLRLRFRKDGALRLVSHHDLMRCFERMLRRAELPFRSTQGFHPKPRVVFAQPLPLGVVGHEEVVELELSEVLDAEDVRRRLNAQAPLGLTFFSVASVPPKAAARPILTTFRLPIPRERGEVLAPRAAEMLAGTECWSERSRPTPRRVDIRPYLEAIRILEDAVEVDVRITPTGTARPDEIYVLLGLGDLLAEGAILERTRLWILDETPNPAPSAAVGPESEPATEAASKAFREIV